MRRVVITGIGLLTALGAGWEPTWKGLLAGQSGVRRLGGYDPSSLRTRIGAELEDFAPSRYAGRRALRLTTPDDQFAIAGAVLAMEDAALENHGYDPGRAGLFLGGSKQISNPDHLLEGCLSARRPDGTADVRLLGEHAASAFYPLYYVEGLQSAALFHVSQHYGLRGANAYFHGTAEAGISAIGRAYRSVRRGESEFAVAGGFDQPTAWWRMSTMDGLGLMTDRNDLESAAMRPYDQDRSGLVFGDGAAMVVLEEYGAAVRRGARIYAEVTGFGNTFATADSAAPLAAAMSSALGESKVDYRDIGYVAAHGSATDAGDVSEVQALRTVFPNHSGLCASAVKPATGHLEAAAGAVNVAVSALALDSGMAPPTLNLQRPDPRCALDWVPGQARELRTRHTMALARGRHGQQVALALGAV